MKTYEITTEAWRIVRYLPPWLRTVLFYVIGYPVVIGGAIAVFLVPVMVAWLVMWLAFGMDWEMALAYAFPVGLVVDAGVPKMVAEIKHVRRHRGTTHPCECGGTMRYRYRTNSYHCGKCFKQTSYREFE